MQKNSGGSNKKFTIKIHKVKEQHSSYNMDDQLDSKMVSLEGRLEKQIQSQKISQSLNGDNVKLKSTGDKEIFSHCKNDNSKKVVNASTTHSNVLV